MRKVKFGICTVKRNSAGMFIEESIDDICDNAISKDEMITKISNSLSEAGLKSGCNYYAKMVVDNMLENDGNVNTKLIKIKINGIVYNVLAGYKDKKVTQVIKIYIEAHDGSTWAIKCDTEEFFKSYKSELQKELV